MTQVKWYRNASEKDLDQPRGEGELVHIGLLERAGEAIAVIIDSNGNFIEKQVSLVKVNDLTREAEAEAELENCKGIIKQLELDLEEANATIKKLEKKPKPVKVTKK